MSDKVRADDGRMRHWIDLSLSFGMPGDRIVVPDATIRAYAEGRARHLGKAGVAIVDASAPAPGPKAEGADDGDPAS